MLFPNTGIIIIISAEAGILLKPQDFYLFQNNFRMILNNSDILFGTDVKREKFRKLPTTIRFSRDGTSEW